MRTIVALFAIVMSTTGCLTGEAPSESESESALTYSWSSPMLEVTARIANARLAADQLQAIAANTKAPLYPTWTTYQRYRTFIGFLTESAAKLDATADLMYEDAVAMRDALEDEKDAIAEQTEQEMLWLQQAMTKKYVLEIPVYDSTASANAETILRNLR